MTTFEALGVLTELRSELQDTLRHYETTLKEQHAEDAKTWRKQKIEETKKRIQAIDKVGSLLTKR